MICAPRTLVSEPFASQMETIEKALIEVQSQPLPYYGRRGTNANNNARSPANNQASVNTGLASGQGPHNHPHNPTKPGQGGNFVQNNKYGYYSAQPSTQSFNQTQNMPSLDYYATNYRNQASFGPRHPSVGHQNSPGLGGGASINNFVAPSNLHSSVGVTPHIPQVFNDEKVYSAPHLGVSTGESPSLMDASKQGEFSTFDPFGNDLAGYGTQSQLFSPMFSSSSNIMNTNYASPSTNIWGNNTKSMAGDAAVWG
ncbi:hypothetical protein OXX80_013019 [Metschnikowia pulcherrima]